LSNAGTWGCRIKDWRGYVNVSRINPFVAKKTKRELGIEKGGYVHSCKGKVDHLDLFGECCIRFKGDKWPFCRVGKKKSFPPSKEKQGHRERDKWERGSRGLSAASEHVTEMIRRGRSVALGRGAGDIRLTSKESNILVHTY